DQTRNGVHHVIIFHLFDGLHDSFLVYELRLIWLIGVPYCHDLAWIFLGFLVSLFLIPLSLDMYYSLVTIFAMVAVAAAVERTTWSLFSWFCFANIDSPAV